MRKEIKKIVFGALRTGILLFVGIGIFGWAISLVVEGNNLFLELLPWCQGKSMLVKTGLGLLLLIVIGGIINSLMGRGGQCQNRILGRLSSIGHFSENLLNAQVVKVEIFPGKYLLGFTNNEAISNPEIDLIPVVVPNTPVPFTGYTLFVERESLGEIKMKPREALALLASGGFMRKP